MRQVEGTISTALKTFVTRCSVSPRFKHLFQDERRFRLSSSFPALTSLRMSHLLCIIRWRQNSLSEQQKRDHCLKNVAFKGIAFLFGCHFFRDFKTDVTQNKIQSEIFARECHWSQPLVLCVCRNERLHSQLYYTSFFFFFFMCAGLHKPVCGPGHVCFDDVRRQDFHAAKTPCDHPRLEGASG